MDVVLLPQHHADHPHVLHPQFHVVAVAEADFPHHLPHAEADVAVDSVEPPLAADTKLLLHSEVSHNNKEADMLKPHNNSLPKLLPNNSPLNNHSLLNKVDINKALLVVHQLVDMLLAKK